MPECDWQTSSYCGTGNNCLGLTASPDGTLRIRESEAPDTFVTVSRMGLGSLIRVIKHGALPSGT
ncbi:DUF397 domain-containing protein [Streptomyces sp. NPDC017056]|uniref:DUF397 domain-containing protein n=1 Tax=Streptomyces sp. NPDC017056 TaxID=3364973 RepID=UPI0037ACA99D